MSETFEQRNLRLDLQDLEIKMKFNQDNINIIYNCTGISNVNERLYELAKERRELINQKYKLLII